ncbi:alpha/beta-type small acid-soluble spore protein [Bacillus thuringiensis]|nr:alpha/beta-type small acid-soluble spore protein [Bacillus thuringiensis]MED2766076.1 alpha/beta-type small acid-soluble spore protein [Bacillus thuringiensis]
MTNKPGSNTKLWMNGLKNDIARELGVTLGAETSARANGSVGGEITKRTVAMSLQQLSGATHTQPTIWNHTP